MKLATFSCRKSRRLWGVTWNGRRWLADGFFLAPVERTDTMKDAAIQERFSRWPHWKLGSDGQPYEEKEPNKTLVAYLEKTATNPILPRVLYMAVDADPDARLLQVFTGPAHVSALCARLYAPVSNGFDFYQTSALSPVCVKLGETVEAIIMPRRLDTDELDHIAAQCRGILAVTDKQAATGAANDVFTGRPHIQRQQ